MAEEFKDIVRLGAADVKGEVSTYMAINKIKGVGFMYANAVCTVLGLDKSEQIGKLSADTIAKIEACVKNPKQYGLPSWLYNRRRDLDSGEDIHIIAADLKLKKEMDIRFLRKIRCYRGIRHAIGAKKVRGQRTRTTGRRGTTLGVEKKKELPKAAAGKGAK